MNSPSCGDDPPDWSPVSRVWLLCLFGSSVVIVWLHLLTQEKWVPLLDHANLALHEAGHPLVALFSDRLSVYGGTLLQLLFPALFVRHFYRERQSAGRAFCEIWLGENFLNVARYMKDARAQVLPLIGGGDHDWTEVFSRWGLLNHDLVVGSLFQMVGLSVICFALLHAWRRSCSE